MKNYEIIPIMVARNDLPKGILTRNVDDDVRIHFPICIYVIKGPKENIIIDSGKQDHWPHYLEEAVRRATGSDDFHPVGETIRGSWPAVVEGLGKLDLKPEDIDIVLVSHVHHEHMGYVKEFPNARFIVQKDDVEYGLNPCPSHRHVYFPEKLWELERHPGREIIDGDKEIVPGVMVLKCPGHTPGMQAVAVETAAGVAVFGSDMCNTYHNIFPDDPELGTPQPYTEFIPPYYLVDMYDCIKSFRKMKAFGDYIIPGHEFRVGLVGMGQMGKIPPIPYVPKQKEG